MPPDGEAVSGAGDRWIKVLEASAHRRAVGVNIPGDSLHAGSRGRDGDDATMSANDPGVRPPEQRLKRVRFAQSMWELSRRLQLFDSRL